MKIFYSMTPLLSTPSLRSTRTAHSSSGVRRSVAVSPTDAARHLKFIVQQEFKSGCQDSSGFSMKMWELVEASDIQLSPISLQTVKEYSNCNLHDRQVVLQALLQQRLSAVLACPPDSQDKSIQQGKDSDAVHAHASQQGIAGGASRVGPSFEPVDVCNGAREQQQHVMEGSNSHPDQGNANSRTWASAWQGNELRQQPLWMSAGRSSNKQDCPAQPAKFHSHGDEQQHPRGHVKNATDSSSHSSGSIQGAEQPAQSPAQQQLTPPVAQPGPGILDRRSMICAHPLPSSTPDSVPSRQHIATPSNAGADTAHVKPHHPVAGNRVQQSSDTLTSNPIEISEHTTHASAQTPPVLHPVQLAAKHAGNGHSTLPSWNAEPGNQGAASPPAHVYTRAPAQEVVQHEPLQEAVSSDTPTSEPRGGEIEKCSERILTEACIPFSDESQAWYSTQLFGHEQDHSEHVPLKAHAAPYRYPKTGRELLRVSLPGSSLFDYCLPSLLPSECEFIADVERRLKAAQYDSKRVVPIFWDTEGSGFKNIEWWDGSTDRIVQIGALTDSKHGDLVFKKDVNPFPVRMSKEAEAVTNLATSTVWSSDTCPQVALAEFLDFCLRASEANAGAMPMLVAHNSSYDNGMLLSGCWQAGIQVPRCWMSLCSCALSKGVAEARPDLGIVDHKLGPLAAQFGSSVSDADLHDALADAKQIPIITEAFERLAGSEFSLAGLVGRKPGVKFGAQTFDVLVRKRHVKLNERLVKKRTSDPTPLVSEPRAATHQHSSDAREQSSTRQTKSNEPAQLQENAGTSKASAKSSNRSASNANEAAWESRSPHEPSAVLSKAPTVDSESTGTDSHSKGGSLADTSSDEAPLVDDVARSLSLNDRRLEYMLSSGIQDDDDPFLSAWPKGIQDSGKVEFLSGNMFDQEGLQDAWSPFTKPLQDVGLPRRTFRAPLLAKLNAAGFSNVLDLVRYTPRHEKKDYPSIHIEELSGKVSVQGSIVSVGRPLNLLSDDGLVVERPFEASIFAGPGFRGTFKLEKDAQRLMGAEEADALVAMVGRFKEDKRSRGNKDGYTFTVTEFDVVDDRALQALDNAPEDEQALSVYPARRGITHADFARYIPKVLSHIKDSLPEAKGEIDDDKVPPGDFLPQWVLEGHDLMPWLEALSVLHAGLGSGHPAAVRKRARRRMVFNECLLLSLMMLHHRIAAQLSDSSSLAPVVCKSKTRVETGTAALPYTLTNAQQRVLTEILQDMEAPVPMLRLLQGDVGSGKTAVIFLAALAAISSGHQVAILVPNDVLATQHDTFISKVSSNMPEEHQPVVEVLAGRVGVKRRREVRERLAAGEIDIIIGTTALNNPQEIFSSLGLVVIDEQHRFGVKQRANLVKKNPDAPAPHVLFATATPIPRTVAMTHMSHMTTSVIDELPPGRVPVETSIVKVKAASDVTDGSTARQKVLERVQEEIEQGGSVFWVFPLVDESEHFQDMGSAYKASELLQAQGGLIAEQTVVITGRMSSEAKAVALDAFRAGHCRLLVSTVVIEVGIDVPAATLMVVEHAERFGLLQLHQLRGRVGRSDKPSSCWLVTSSKGAMPRLQVLEQFSQGRAVAEQDLVLRGAGQLFGQRQSGPADMGLGALLLATDLAADEEVVANAREVAAELTRNYGFKDLPPPLLAALSGYNMTSLLALKMQDVDIHM